MTRQSAPVQLPVVLTIAGSDSGGGAGVQADLKTIEAGGAFGTSAVTSVTAQHTRGVERTFVLPLAEIEAQIDAVLEDYDVAAVKTGMLATADVIRTVEEYASDLSNLVVDPVMVAASGDRLLEPEAESAYEHLVGSATLITPNADEAEVLTGIDVTDVDAARRAGELLLETGVDGALVTGGHVPGEDVVDTLVTAEGTRTFRHDRIEDAATHGSGCTLSSAIATQLAHGEDLVPAVAEGVSLLSTAVRYHLDVGQGSGTVHHLADVRNEVARRETLEAVAGVVERLTCRDVRDLVPDAGTNVVGATPYAETPSDVAGVNGGIARTVDGVRATGGIRFGTGPTVGRTLLRARDVDPDLRFATTLSGDDHVEAVLRNLPGSIARAGAETASPSRSPDELAEAVRTIDETPAVLIEPEEDGRRRLTVLTGSVAALETWLDDLIAAVTA